MLVSLEAFQLSGSEKISDFLYSPEQLSFCSRLGDITYVFANRMQHYKQTGIWIDERACLRLCNECSIEDLSLIQRMFNSEVAKQYPAFLSQELRSKKLSGKAGEAWLFLNRFYQDPTTVGSFFPSSPLLSEAIVKHIPNIDPNDTQPRRILEVGAGTGSFTEHIVERLKPNDHLDIVEIDPEFCAVLREKFGHLKNVTVHQRSILDYEAEQYDVLVTGLPLNAFRANFVQQVFDKYIHLTKDNGHISYFEYMGLPSISRHFMSVDDRRNLDRILELKQDFSNRYNDSLDNVWFNLTPAKVQHWTVRERPRT